MYLTVVVTVNKKLTGVPVRTGPIEISYLLLILMILVILSF